MYRRFLNDNDYRSIMTREGLQQLTRGDHDRYIQAEEASEASIIDYLSENYEIEAELEKGKRIAEYNSQISYPIGVHFYLDGVIYETTQAINGYKAPSSVAYWEEVVDDVDVDKLPRYSQLGTYRPDDMVSVQKIAYKCVTANGLDFGIIKIPGIDAWQQVETYDWEAIEYSQWEVVKYDGNYYTLMSVDDDFDYLVNPYESDYWGLIAEYDSSTTYELSETEYVVYNDAVYYPVINPNADTPTSGTNIKQHDPRNYNLKRHMTQLALYELHKLISPNNISSVRLDDYDHSMTWLKNASRLRINPQIPRKVDSRKEPLTDWQMATFQTSFDPWQNPWLV